MDNIFINVMKSKSDEDLMTYIDNYHIYQLDAFEAALIELRERGKTFAPKKIEQIRSEMNKLNEEEQNEQNDVKYDWEKNITTNSLAPKLYSERAINLFSLIFSPLFGAVLLSINLFILNKKYYSIIVAIFGFIFVSLTLVAFDISKLNGIYIFIVNGFGASILHYFFWYRYIGKNFNYQKRSALLPLIISTMISASLILYILIVQK